MEAPGIACQIRDDMLRRIVGKMFNELHIKGWCREQEVKNGLAPV